MAIFRVAASWSVDVFELKDLNLRQYVRGPMF